MKERKINIEFIRVFAIIMTVVIHVSNVYIYSFNHISEVNYLISVIFNNILLNNIFSHFIIIIL